MEMVFSDRTLAACKGIACFRPDWFKKAYSGEYKGEFKARLSIRPARKATSNKKIESRKPMEFNLKDTSAI
jgi:hypothetical protein